MLYNHNLVEKKWQQYWAKNQTYYFIDEPDKPKFYCLDMFPYPSGSGLHVGHLKGYLATEILARYKKMCGYSVLHPMGWDGFGLPAEQYALKTGNHPATFTNQNINYFRSQLQKIGFSFNFNCEVNTTDPAYFKTTQWIFLQLYHHGLAKLKTVNVNWCAELKSVLANEEVIIKNGQRVSERGEHPVVYRSMEQWVLKITKYADKLLAGLADLAWPEGIKNHQQKWIGRAEKYRLIFNYNHFTIPIDLNYLSQLPVLVGIILNYYHPFTQFLIANHPELKITNYYQDVDQLTDYQLPITINTNFTKQNYTVTLTKKLSQPTAALIPVFRIKQEELDLSHEQQLVQYHLNKKTATLVVTYQLHDWVFSRQRYWGEPIPLYYDPNGNCYPELELPLTLPEISDFAPGSDGQSPLVHAKNWLYFPKNGQTMRRDSNTMPNWAGSCWYYLAYLLRVSDGYLAINSPEAWKRFARWLPVDVYIGGQEHAVLHLLYARFWHAFLYDLKIVPTPEPFFQLVNQGMILGFDGQKMSKSKGNVVNPDEIVVSHGADALRLYECFMGPLSVSLPWNERNLNAVRKWIDRVYVLFINLDKYQKQADNHLGCLQLGARLITEFENGLKKFSLNLGVSAMMKFINQINATKQYSLFVLKTFVKILSFYAPHLAEELWFQVFGQRQSVYLATWDHYDPQLLQEHQYQLPIMVNNKLKVVLTISEDDDQLAIEQLAFANNKIKSSLVGHKIVKKIYVHKKIFNLITKKG